jgi:RNA polymerase sigma factor (sigma-70 family)
MGRGIEARYNSVRESESTMTDSSSDRSAELLNRWQREGDRSALDELLRTEVAVLKEKMRRQGAPGADAAASVSDVAQEAVLRMLRVEPPPVFETPEAMRGYLWLAAWRLLVAKLRRPDHDVARFGATQSAPIDGALETTGGFSRIDAKERAVALELALQLLEPDEREILDLAYFHDVGVDELAKRLGISQEAARKRLARARKSLAGKLATWTELIG